MCVIKGGIKLKLSICRRPVSTVLESEVKMKMPDGNWDPFAFRLLSNRNIEFEKLSPPQYTGEIHARLAHSLDLRDDGPDKVLKINTGHKDFELKASSKSELAQWHLRLQEVIMLQEKVANVAHGWLLKEEGGVGGTQLKHFWFVLFSNGILMHFSDPNRANLGQSLGFIPVEECVESSHSSKQHTLHIKCTFDQWLLATNSKENMLQWAQRAFTFDHPRHTLSLLSHQPSLPLFPLLSTVGGEPPRGAAFEDGQQAGRRSDPRARLGGPSEGAGRRRGVGAPLVCAQEYGVGAVL